MDSKEEREFRELVARELEKPEYLERILQAAMEYPPENATIASWKVVWRKDGETEERLFDVFRKEADAWDARDWIWQHLTNVQQVRVVPHAWE